MSGPSERGLENFRNASSAIPRIIVLALLLFCVVLWLVWKGIYPLKEFGITFPLQGQSAIGKLVFIAYTCGFTAMWLTYFSSRWEHRSKLFRCRTLRLLLHETSMQWGSPNERIKQFLPDAGAASSGRSSADLDGMSLSSVEDYFKDKARTSMQTLGMLIAAAALELGQVNAVNNWQFGAQGKTDDPAWSAWTLSLAALAAIGAFIMFVVSVDSLDTMFNRFRGASERHLLIDHFYRNTINLRYFGLVFLLLGAVMVMANLSPWLAATAMGLIFALGISSWFPTIRDKGEVGTGSLLTERTVFRVALVMCPGVIRFFLT